MNYEPYSESGLQKLRFSVNNFVILLKINNVHQNSIILNRASGYGIAWNPGINSIEMYRKAYIRAISKISLFPGLSLWV